MSSGTNETSDVTIAKSDDQETREAAKPIAAVTGPRTAPRLPSNRNVG